MVGSEERNILKQLGRRALGDPGARQSLEIASFCWDRWRGGIDLAQDIVNVHGESSQTEDTATIGAFNSFPEVC